MRKEFPLFSTLLALGLAGCGEAPVQHDLYSKVEDCIADWGKPELCQEVIDSENQAQKVAQQNGQTVAHPGFIFWGPGYTGSRSVNYGGQTITPVSTASRSFAMQSVSPSSGKPSGISTPSARGGFGSAGRSAGISAGG